MAKQYMRTYQEFDLDDITKHLLLLGDLSADCAACRAFGIPGNNAAQCPECGTTFKYVTSRRLEHHSGERFSLVRRTRERRPDLIFIDYTDYNTLVGKKKARDFLSG